MNRTPIVPAIGMVVGYALAAVGVGASFWNLTLERSVWLTPKPSIVWSALVFVGLSIAQGAEVARIKRVMGPTFPKMKDAYKMYGIALVLALAGLLLILK